MAAKFIVAGGMPIDDDLWSNKLVYYRYYIILDNETIEDLRRGIKVGKQLGLPEDCSFNLKYLMDLLITRDRLRPFPRLL